MTRYHSPDVRKGRYTPGPGQIHTSLVAAGGIVSAAEARSQMAAALSGFFDG